MKMCLTEWPTEDGASEVAEKDIHCERNATVIAI